jgi:hypothetical protein
MLTRARVHPVILYGVTDESIRPTVLTAVVAAL